MRSGIEVGQDAAKFARGLVVEKGLLTADGDMPSAYQLGTAALHGREDVAACVYMIVAVMERQRTIQRWLYFITFLLVCVLSNLR